MKTEQVKIKEFKVLRDFTADFKGAHVLVMGDNEVGKSSLLQFIQIALGKTDNIPQNATGSGEVIINKDGKQFTFQVKFKDNKPVVTVISPDGIKDSRRGTIATIVGALDFDIDKFVELSKTVAGRKKQVEIYKQFLPFEVIEFMDKMELKIKATYDDRTSLNRDIKALEGSISLHPLANQTHELDKLIIKDVDTTKEQIKKAQKTNENVTKVKAGIESKGEQIVAIQKEIDAKLLQITTLKEEIKKGETWLKTNKVTDISKITTSIQTSDQATQLKADMEKVEKLKLDVGEATALIESSQQAIVETIKQIDSPVENLTYDEDGLYWNGTAVNPDNLSTSQIIELGVRLKMAENPNLGMLFIEHGESIGTERLKVIKEIADKNGFQIIMEQVERGNKKLHIEIMAD